VAGILTYCWQRFLWLGWTGRAVTIIVALYAVGWVFGKVGAVGTAHQFGSAGAAVLAALVTALICRGLWRRAGSQR
jgi:membrane protein DedA with SNARE-associated domain